MRYVLVVSVYLKATVEVWGLKLTMTRHGYCVTSSVDPATRTRLEALHPSRQLGGLEDTAKATLLVSEDSSCRWHRDAYR